MVNTVSIIKLLIVISNNLSGSDPFLPSSIDRVTTIAATSAAQTNTNKTLNQHFKRVTEVLNMCRGTLWGAERRCTLC